MSQSISASNAGNLAQESGSRTPLSVAVRQEIASLRSRRSNLRSALDLGSTYLILALALWVACSPTFHWAWKLPAFLMIGLMQYRLVMSSHEAVHKTLLTPVALNETFGTINAALVGISFFNYRKTHLDHHKSPQYIRDDSDAYIYKPLLQTKPGFPRLFLLLFGVWVDIYVKLKRKVAGIRPHQEKVSAENAVASQMGVIVTLQILLLGSFALFSHWYHYFLFWFAPIFTIALTMDRIRIFVEHGYHYLFSQDKASVEDALQATVDIHTSFLEAYFLAPFGFDNHQAHHAHLTVPYYNLPQLSHILAQNDARYNPVVKGSYLLILFRMIWAQK